MFCRLVLRIACRSSLIYILNVTAKWFSTVFSAFLKILFSWRDIFDGVARWLFAQIPPADPYPWVSASGSALNVITSGRSFLNTKSFSSSVMLYVPVFIKAGKTDSNTHFSKMLGV